MIIWTIQIEGTLSLAESPFGALGCFWLLSPLEAPKWVQDLGNGPQMIPPTIPD